MKSPRLVAGFFSILCILFIVFRDVSGVYFYRDMPFVVSGGLNIFVFLFLVRSATPALTVSLICLLFMGLSFMQNGASVTTERLGEWFYIFFLCGLVQSIFLNLGNDNL